MCEKQREEKWERKYKTDRIFEPQGDIYSMYIYRIPCNKVFQVFSKYQLNSFEFIKNEI